VTLSLPLLSLSSLVEVLTDTLELTLVPVTVPTRSRPESSVNLTTSSWASGVVAFSVVVVVGCSLLRSKFLNGRLIETLLLDSLLLLDSPSDRFRLDVGSRFLCLVCLAEEEEKFLGFCGVTFVLALALSLLVLSFAGLWA